MYIIYLGLDACLYDWRFDQSLEGNRDQVLYASTSKSASAYYIRVRACVKYIVWEHKTEYTLSKGTKFQLEQVDVLPSKNQALCKVNHC